MSAGGGVVCGERRWLYAAGPYAAVGAADADILTGRPGGQGSERLGVWVREAQVSEPDRNASKNANRQASQQAQLSCAQHRQPYRH